MKRPPLASYLLGNPFMVTGVMLGGLYLLYRCWWVDPSSWLTGLPVVVAMSSVMNANERITDYASWKRAWDNAGGDSRPPSKVFQHPAIKVLVLLVMVLALALYHWEHRDQAEHRFGLGWLVAVTALIAIIWIGRTIERHRRRQRAKKVERAADSERIVSVCVRHPVLPVPTLQRAYATLPEHCRTVLHAAH